MKYHFEVKTADQYLAGTDSNIFVRLYGDRGISKVETRLNGYISGNAFERDCLDTFDIDMSDDMGDIYMIDVRSDCSYGGSDWMCSYFEIARIEGEVWGPRVTFGFPSGMWIDDEDVHQMKATAGYPLDVPVHEENLIKLLGAKHYVPAGLEMQLSCTTSFTVNVDLSKVKVVENTTRVALNVETEVIKTAFENELKVSVSEQLNSNFGKTLERSSNVIISPQDVLRVFQEVWWETDYAFHAVLGQDTYSFGIPAERVFGGLIKVEPDENLKKIMELPLM